MFEVFNNNIRYLLNVPFLYLVNFHKRTYPLSLCLKQGGVSNIMYTRVVYRPSPTFSTYLRGVQGEHWTHNLG